MEFTPFGRICNPTAWSISICNAKKSHSAADRRFHPNGWNRPACRDRACPVRTAVSGANTKNTPDL